MNTKRFRADPDYWDRKLANYLHDPPDKALRIPGHEERSCALLKSLGAMSSPDKNSYQRADQIAAGMDRTKLPGYAQDASQNGAVNFLQLPVLTHPIGSDPALHLILSKTNDMAVTATAIDEIIRRDIDGHLEQPGLSNKYRNDRDSFSPARFHYVHHVLRERLANENVAGLGGVWHRMPADTRIPDHSIWQHCALVSALASCFELSGKKHASLLVFNITPVQDFISSARKLRDFWTGSLILSWLAFEGIRQVIYELGSDHILYPSLIGQPLVNRLLARECGLSWLDPVEKGEDSAGVASFPNKFVCLVPTGNEQETAQIIQQAILETWLHLGDKTLEMIEKVVHLKDSHLGEQFKRQMGSYWNFHWAACPLLDNTSHDTIRQLLHKAIWERPLEFAKDAQQFAHTTRGEGGLYGVSHALTQGFLAAGKTCRTDQREKEPGIKCSLHGDLEALRFDWKGGDRNPRPGNDPFWSTFKKNWKPESDFKASERLSAVAMVKRLAYRVCKSLPEHPLNAFFTSADKFPSTTEMALADWLDRAEPADQVTDLGPNWRQKVAQYLHEIESERRERAVEPDIAELEEKERGFCREIIHSMRQGNDPVQDDDKYYAILLMDGDRMGRLVNGETLASTWQAVLHPHLVGRFKDPKFDRHYRDFWEKRLDSTRLLAPAVHAAISEALADFALFSVPAIIMRKYRGQLIYAGGDDVCAVLPVSTVLQAAREIANVYSHGFVFFPPDKNEAPKPLNNSWQPETGRLALHLGAGPEISISAGILIAHHKKPLTVAMRRAHKLLKRAKKEGGRNGLALELEKRSGGGRIFMARWDEGPFEELWDTQTNQSMVRSLLLDHFTALGKAMGSPSLRTMSVSLAYRLEQFRPGLEAIIDRAPRELAGFLVKQMERSRKEEDRENNRLLASQLAALLARKTRPNEAAALDTASPVIAKFIGGRIARNSRRQGESSYEQG